MTRNSTKARRICFETHQWIGPLGRLYLTCHMCKSMIDPVRQDWRADHIRRHAEGGEDTADNLWPICLPCDAGTDGKAAKDTAAVAHGKRAADRHYGVKRPGGWQKRPEGYRYDWRTQRYVRQ